MTEECEEKLGLNQKKDPRYAHYLAVRCELASLEKIDAHLDELERGESWMIEILGPANDREDEDEAKEAADETDEPESEEHEFDSVAEVVASTAGTKMMDMLVDLTAKVRALEEANAAKRLKYLESARNVPHMFFNQLDKRLAIVEGAIAGRPTPGPSNYEVPEHETSAGGSVG